MALHLARRRRRLVWIAAVVLLILHQDWWLWGNGHLLLGFLPIGLGYHMLFSVVSSLLWAVMVFWAWPTEIEAWADAKAGPGAGGEA